MTKREAYRILDGLLVAGKVFSPTVESALAMALDDMMVVARLENLEQLLTGLMEEIKGLKETRSEEQ